MVETDENRTRIARVQTGSSPVELQPRTSWVRRAHGARCDDRESLLELYEVQRAGRGTVRATVLAERAVRSAVNPNLELGKLAFCQLFYGRIVEEPSSGLAPEPAVYETAARTARAARTRRTHVPKCQAPWLQREDSNLHLSG